MTHAAIDTQLMKLWKAGYGLSRAWQVFAPAELREQLEQSHQTSAVEAFQAATSEANEGFTRWEEKLAHAFQAPAAILNKRARISKQMQDILVGHLRNGRLIGFGFEPPRKMETMPFELPARTWFGVINWDNMQVTHEGLTFEQVRILHPRKRSSLLAPSELDLPKTNPVGRPGVGPQIEAACRALIEAGKVDVTSHAASHYAAIRQELLKRFPNLSVPAEHISDKTLSRHFSPIFRDLQRRTKL